MWHCVIINRGGKKETVWKNWGFRRLGGSRQFGSHLCWTQHTYNNPRKAYFQVIVVADTSKKRVIMFWIFRKISAIGSRPKFHLSGHCCHLTNRPGMSSYCGWHWDLVLWGMLCTNYNAKPSSLKSPHPIFKSTDWYNTCWQLTVAVLGWYTHTMCYLAPAMCGGGGGRQYGPVQKCQIHKRVVQSTGHGYL